MASKAQIAERKIKAARSRRNHKKSLECVGWAVLLSKLALAALVLLSAAWSVRWYVNLPPPPPKDDIVLYHATVPQPGGLTGLYKYMRPREYMRTADPERSIGELHIFQYGAKWHVTNETFADVTSRGEGTEFPVYISSTRAGPTPAGQRFMQKGKKRASLQCNNVGVPEADAALIRDEKEWQRSIAEAKAVTVIEMGSKDPTSGAWSDTMEGGTRPPVFGFYTLDTTRSPKNGASVFTKVPHEPEARGSKLLDAWPADAGPMDELFLWRMSGDSGQMSGLWAIGGVDGVDYLAEELASEGTVPVVGITTVSSPNPLGATWQFGNGTTFNVAEGITTREAKTHLAERRAAESQAFDAVDNDYDEDGEDDEEEEEEDENDAAILRLLDEEEGAATKEL